jgi:hypothetical protein
MDRYPMSDSHYYELIDASSERNYPRNKDR